jgi:hypothetical protein
MNVKLFLELRAPLGICKRSYKIPHSVFIIISYDFLITTKSSEYSFVNSAPFITIHYNTNYVFYSKFHNINNFKNHFFTLSLKVKRQRI